MSNPAFFKAPRGRPRKLNTQKINTKRPHAGRPKKDEGLTSIKSTIVFHYNRQAQSQLIINRGSARSGKSYSIAQLLIEWFFTIPKIKIIVLRKTQPSLRLSVMPLIYDLLSLYNVRDKVEESKQYYNLISPLGGLIHFGGLDDPEKIRSSEWHVIWLEEATEFTYDDFINLKLRLSAPATVQGFKNRMILSFNPVDEYHWIREKVMNNSTEDFTEIHSTYRMNPFLSSDYVRTIESLKDQDLNYWRIFAEGEWGKLDHLIYTNWISTPHEVVGDQIYGLDFGYNAPSSLIKLNLDGYEVGVQELLYQTNLTNSDLIVRLDQLIPPDKRGYCPLYCDAAEPDRIEEIRRAGFWALPASKEVRAGIDFVKRCRLRITENSDNVLKEIRGYSFKTDKNGVVVDEPVKFNDHSMDAIRYALYTYHVEGRDSGADSYFRSV